MKKLILVLLLSVFSLTLVACDEGSPSDGIDCDIYPTHKDCAPPEDTCFAPSDYSSELTYELVWSDEFDGNELDSAKWKYEVNGLGGGNNELQYYTDENTVVSDGTLKIIAKNEDYLGREYTSSRITTEFKASWKYGIVEAKAIVPGGTGTWPAIWMMPVYSRYGGWPRSGEIDIMEYVGYNPYHLHGTIHTKIYNGAAGTQKGGSTNAYDDITTEFHIYKIEWLPDKILFFVDEELIYTYDPSRFSSCPTSDSWPFNSSFFLIMNVAIGGDWGGAQGVDDSIFPVQMEIDYVRVYQANELENYDDHSE